ncbi:MAG TPA: SRPBCC family protein [Nocardioidaceae bacterium]|nr:SRPBCC family protein [Nocardioidaceae bacterium]
MPSIDKTREYAATPEQLWSAVSDLRAWTQWLTVLKEWRSEPPTELAVGVILEATISVMKIPMAVTWTINECREPVTLTMSGPAVLNSKVTLSCNVAASAGGSTVALHIDVDNPMLMGPLADTLMNAVNNDVEESMANLDARLSV